MCERTPDHHAAKPFPIYRMFSKFMVMFSYKRADLVLANSYAMQTDLVENFRIKTPVRVIYNPIDLHFIKTHVNEEPGYVFDRTRFILSECRRLPQEKESPAADRAFLF